MRILRKHVYISHAHGRTAAMREQIRAEWENWRARLIILDE